MSTLLGPILADFCLREKYWEKIFAPDKFIAVQWGSKSGDGPARWVRTSGREGRRFGSSRRRSTSLLGSLSLIAVLFLKMAYIVVSSVEEENGWKMNGPINTKKSGASRGAKAHVPVKHLQLLSKTRWIGLDNSERGSLKNSVFCCAPVRLKFGCQLHWQHKLGTVKEDTRTYL